MQSFIVRIISFIYMLMDFCKKPYHRKNNAFSKANKILIFATFFGLGNAVLLTPALVSLLKSFAGIKIDIYTKNPVAAYFFKLSGLVNDIYLGENISKLKDEISYFIKNIRPKHYDVILETFLENENSHILTLVAKPKHSIAYGAKGWSKHLNTINIEMNPQLHEVERHLEIIKFMGGKNIQNTLYLNNNSHKTNFSDEFFRTNRINKGEFIIGIHPGTALGTSKKGWAVEKFSVLVDELSKQRKVRIIFFFGQEDLAIIQKIKSKTKAEHAHLINEDLMKVIDLISKCNLFICNDSGLMHIAAAAKVPIVAIFGPTIPQKNHPWQVKYCIVRKELQCSPCYEVGGKKYLTCKRMNCLEYISVEEVFSKVSRFMRELGTLDSI